MAFTKITASGIGSTETVTLDGLSVINDGSFGGNVTIGGTLTYEDVTNIDSVGLITARAGVVVGSGITLSKDGDIFATGITTVSGNIKVGTGITLSPDGDGFFTGVVTATSYAGDGSALTGISVDSTQIVTGNTSVQTVDTGSDGHVKVNTEGSERLRITSSGQVFIGDGVTSSYDMVLLRNTNGNLVSQIANLNTGNATKAYFQLQTGTDRYVNLENDYTNQYFQLQGNNITTAYYTFDTHIFRANNATERARIDSSGHLLPGANNTYDLGSTGTRWRNVYTNDLNLSNKGSTNSVDNTWGDYTIQEGESDLFLINNRSGKKYKFNLTEVS